MKKRIAIVGGLVVAVGLIGGIAWYVHSQGQGSSSEQQVYVSTVATVMGDISGTQNRYAGIVEPQKTVNVKVENNRTVKEVKVEEGQSVKKGDVLFEYDESAAQTDLAQAQLDLERYKNEAVSLQNQIDTYTKEKATAAADEQLSYTIQIQTAEMDLKKNEYNQKSKEAEIKKLEESQGDLEVTSDIDGVIRTINTSAANMGGSDDDSSADSSSNESGSGSSNFITIVATGTYRVKGTINETNIQSIVEGDPVIIRSRVDSDVTWKGTMEGVDTEKQDKQSNNSDVYMDSGSSGTEETQSSTYPFYVQLDSSDGLILGQHVYIEMDYGQTEVKDGIWLEDFYIVDADTEPYVWASNSRDQLEKRSVTLGEYDEELGKYEITEGLTKEDCIAFPDDTYEEGMPTTINAQAQTLTGGTGAEAGMDSDVDSSVDSSIDSDSDSSMDSDSDSSFEVLEGSDAEE